MVNKSDGRVDLRYNPLSVDEDYFIPVRGGDSGTDISSLAGGQNTSAIEDVEYIQKKLFAALKIPKAYLGYDEEIGSKATLAQEDIRFSRTIQRIQKTVISELNKIAMIHLYSHGFTGEDLVDFDLKLSNPSSIAQQQKLELINQKFEIAGKVPEGMLDKDWVRKHVLGLTDEEIKLVEQGRVTDKLRDAEVEATGAEGGGDAGGGGGDEAGGDEGGGLFAGDFADGDILDGSPLPVGIAALPEGDGLNEEDLDEEDLDEDDDDIIKFSLNDESGPVKADNMVKNIWNEPMRKSRSYSAERLHSPDFKSMTGVGKSTRKRDSMNSPYDSEFFKNPFGENLRSNVSTLLDNKKRNTPKMDASMKHVINNLSNLIDNHSGNVLLESDDPDIEIDLDEESSEG